MLARSNLTSWLFLFAAFMGLPGFLAAQDMQVRAVLNPDRIFVGEIGEYQIYLSNVPAEPESLAQPEVAGLEFGGFGQQSYMTTNNLNRFGQMTTQRQLVYTWRLIAQAPGIYTIPGQTITIAGIDYRLEDKILKVEEVGDAFGDQLSLFFDLPAEPIYVGQVINAPVRLRIRQGASIELNSKRPQRVPGDEVQEIRMSDKQRYQDVREGSNRFTDISWDYVFSPTRSGPHNLRFGFNVRIMDSRTGRWRGVTILTPDTPVQVAPLPEQGRPASFTGGVGQFDITSKWSATTASTGEPIELTLTVSGRGNLARMAAPTLPELPGWRSYPPRVEQAEGDPVLGGTRTFSYVLIPQTPSITQTPEIRLAWFDPHQVRYHEEVVAPRALHVTGDAIREASPQQDAIRRAAPGVGPLATSPGGYRPDMQPLFYRPGYWAVNGGLAIALALAVGGTVVRRTLQNDVGRQARQRQRKALETHLQTTRDAARQHQADAFHDAALKTLQQAAAPAGTAPETLTIDAIAHRVTSAKLTEEHRTRLLALLRRADALRYGGRREEPDYTADLAALEAALAPLQTTETRR